MGGMSGLAGRTHGSCVKRHPVRGAFYYNEVAVGAGYFVYVSRVILGM